MLKKFMEKLKGKKAYEITQDDIDQLNKLSQAELYEIAKEWDAPETLRCAAVERITDIDVILELSYNRVLSETCEKLLDEVTNQKKLIHIAKNAFHKIGINAFNKITNPKAIEDIALGKGVESVTGSKVRTLAIQQMSDQKVLAKIALNDEHVYFREEAVALLTDQQALYEVALKQRGSVLNDQSDIDVRCDAIKRINDKNLLNRIIKGGDKLILRWRKDYEHYMTHQPPSEEGYVDLREVAKERLAEIEAEQ